MGETSGTLVTVKITEERPSAEKGEGTDVLVSVDFALAEGMNTHAGVNAVTGGLIVALISCLNRSLEKEEQSWRKKGIKEAVASLLDEHLDRILATAKKAGRGNG